VRKSCFTSRTLEFLKFYISPSRPPPSFLLPLLPPLPRSSVAAGRRCSSAGATSCLWQLPRGAPRPAAALALSSGLLPRAPRRPASARASPAAATQLLLLAVPSPGLEARFRMLLDFFYPLTRPLLPSSFLCSTTFTGPPPPDRAATSPSPWPAPQQPINPSLFLPRRFLSSLLCYLTIS
jgi:hypothetical protein